MCLTLHLVCRWTSTLNKTIYDSHVSDTPPLPRTEAKSERFPVDDCDNRHVEELVVNVDGQETLWDIVFDAIYELAGVPVRQIQAQTSLRLWLLEELLEEWENMGAICRDDTRLVVAICPSVADALKDEY